MLRAAVIFAVLGASAAQYCKTGDVYSATFNKCYQFFSAPAEFEYADETCQNMGGHLVSIINGQENALIKSNAAKVFGKLNSTDFWIGLSDLANPGTWTWTDGMAFNYNNWDMGQPQTGHCVAESRDDGTWSTAGCGGVKPYICVTQPLQVSTCPPQTTPVPTTCPTPVPCTQRKCVPTCVAGWTYFPTTDFCYKTYYNSKWADAEAFCVSQGGHLTSIHSQIENTFINNLARTGIKEGSPKDLTWIGLHKVNNEWIWTDGTKSDYINWAPKQPDNPNKEFCVETAPDLSHDKWYENWNNEECNVLMRSFVCKMNSIHY